MIYDCFPFCHELDVLRIRLHELAEVVDRFVLVESPVTHSGRRKPLYYRDNSSRFADFGEKIVHIVVDDMPVGDDSWRREAFQRNALDRALSECSDDDIVMISDADEIPRASCVREYRVDQGVMSFQQWLSYYWLNCRDGWWFGSRIMPFGLFRRFSNATSVRHHGCAAISDGGWHFSYLGGISSIRTKLESFAHTEFDLAQYKDYSYLEQVSATGADIFGRSHNWRFVEVDESFPAFVQENQTLLRHLIHDGTELGSSKASRLHQAKV